MLARTGNPMLAQMASQGTSMAGNVAVDTALGAIPVAGDLFDVMFRSNTRNLRIVRRHLDKHHPATRVIEG